ALVHDDESHTCALGNTTCPPFPGGTMFRSAGVRLKIIAVAYISRLVKTKTSSAGKRTVPPPVSGFSDSSGGDAADPGRGSVAHGTWNSPPAGTVNSTLGLMTPFVPETAIALALPGSAAWMPRFTCKSMLMPCEPAEMVTFAPGRAFPTE